MFGPYRIEELLGRGGMGEVHRAYDTARNRFVALKRLPAHLADSQEYQARFRREAEVAARLTESHVIPIHDFGEIDGRLFIDMRLVPGTDLATLLDSAGPLPPKRAVDIVAQIASALAAAHDEGLIHRDVKPSNILLNSGHRDDFAYLVDFGLAHTPEATAMTATGLTIGTLAYMAPERFLGRPPDHRVDIYALGCVLYEALTSTRPYPGDSAPELMYGHLNTTPPILDRPDAPPGLADVITRALAKDPDHRYRSAADLADAARDTLGAEPAGVPPTAPAPTPPATPTGPATPTDAATPTGPAAPTDAAAPTGPAAPTDAARSSPTLAEPESRPAAPLPAEPAPPPATLVAPDRPTEPAPAPQPLLSAPSPAAPAPRRSVPKRKALMIGLVVLALIAAGVVALVRARGGAPDSTDAASGASDSRPPAPPKVSKPLVRQPSVVATIPVAASPRDIAVAPDGRVYVAQSDQSGGSVEVLDPARAAVAGVVGLGGTGLTSVATTPDSRHVLATTFRGSPEKVVVIDTATNSVSASISLPPDADPRGMVVAPDGKRAYLRNFSKSVLVVDTLTNAVVDTMPVDCNGGSIGDLAISPDGHRLYVACWAPGGLRVLDTRTKAVLAVNSAVPGSLTIAASPDDGTLLVGDSARVNFVDPATNSETAKVQVTSRTIEQVWDVAISPDGLHGYVLAADTAKVPARFNLHVIDMATHAIVASLPVGTTDSSWIGTGVLAVSPDGRRAYVTWAGSGVAVVDTGSD
jgi:serine/threonine-protein kinase